MQEYEKKNGIIAGISLIIMAIAAGYSFGYVHNQLMVESSEATMKNLISHKYIFYTGLAGWIVIFVADLIVAIALFRFFKSTARQASFITSLLRILYTFILGIALFQLFMVIPLLSAKSSGPDVSTANSIALLVHKFEEFWSLGLIIFGIHLSGLGYLSLRSHAVPNILGYLLLLGGLSYIFIHGFRNFELMDVDLISRAENFLSLPMALAEIMLALWLIYRGLKKERKLILA